MENVEFVNYLYNSKSKIYPDGTMVSTYSSIPRFTIVPLKGKKRPKIDPDILAYDPYRSFDIPFDPNWDKGGYIHIDGETGEPLFTSPFLKENEKFFEAIRPVRKDNRSDISKRARDKIYDLVALNKWDYFFTGTLGNTSFNASNASEAVKPLQNWLSHMVKRYGLKYVLVAELQPKSGKIHFHGFINDVLEMVDSGTRVVPWYKKPVKIETILRKGYDPADYADRIVYNVPQWKFGFTTAIKAYNGSSACASYIMKYITKESKAVFGRYYWSSRNLRREPNLLFRKCGLRQHIRKRVRYSPYSRLLQILHVLFGGNRLFLGKRLSKRSMPFRLSDCRRKFRSHL